jgi:23S rRNA pseudouridine1911/1915/1917 synthase
LIVQFKKRSPRLSGTSRQLSATDEEAGERIDRWLAAKIPELSRSRIQALIKEGAVSSGRRTIGEAGERVKPGTVYRIDVPEAQDPVPKGEDIDLQVVFEDDHLIVIDKPAGLVVHPAPGHDSGTLVNALISHCGDSLSGIGGVKRPGIVHRLDKDTSGLLVVAKTDAAHAGLSEQFAEHGRDGRLHRAYRAFVWGVPDRPSGVIDAPLGRSQSNRKKMAVVAEAAGRHARTRYQTEQVFTDTDSEAAVALLRLELETGRTHQIRVHLAHIRHPVLGDPVYGTGFKASSRRLSDTARAALFGLHRQALHAAELGFEHPVTGEDLEFSSPLPRDMSELLTALGGAP